MLVNLENYDYFDVKSNAIIIIPPSFYSQLISPLELLIASIHKLF